jgi:hypothetical protein
MIELPPDPLALLLSATFTAAADPLAVDDAVAPVPAVSTTSCPDLPA